MDLRKHSSTSNIVRLFIRSLSTGLGITGLDHTDSGIVISTQCDNESSATRYHTSGGTVETISTLGTFATPTASKCRFKQVDDTYNPGFYELQIADARFAVANAKKLVISIFDEAGTYGFGTVSYEIGLTQIDLYNATTAGIGNLDAAISTRLAGASYTAPLDAAGVRTAVGLASANLDTQLGDLPTNSELTTALADLPTNSELTTALADLPTNSELTTALADLPTNAELATALASADDAVLVAIAALNNLSAAQVNAEVDQALADVGLTTTVTGRIDAAISTRLAGAAYTAPDNSGIAAIKAKTDNLPTDPADASDIATALTVLSAYGDAHWATATGFAVPGDAMTLTSDERQDVADVILSRSVANVEDSAAPHSLCYLVLASSESVIEGNTLTVKKTDGATFVTKTLTKTPGDDPIRAIT